MMDAAEKHDANLEAALDEALAPYRDVLPAEELQSFREILRDELARHPVSATLLKQLAPPPVVQQSDDVVRDDAAAEPASGGERESGGGKR
jgi:hypothetical protein